MASITPRAPDIDTFQLCNRIGGLPKLHRNVVQLILNYVGIDWVSQFEGAEDALRVAAIRNSPPLARCAARRKAPDWSRLPLSPVLEPLRLAVRLGHIEMVTYFDACGVPWGGIGYDLLGEAIKQGRVEMVKFLIAKKVPYYRYKRARHAPLVIAATRGHLPMLEYFAYVDRMPWAIDDLIRSLVPAVGARRILVVEFLLRLRRPPHPTQSHLDQSPPMVDVSVENDSALWLAAVIRRDVPMANLLWRNGANIFGGYRWKHGHSIYDEVVRQNHDPLAGMFKDYMARLRRGH